MSSRIDAWREQAEEDGSRADGFSIGTRDQQSPAPMKPGLFACPLDARDRVCAVPGLIMKMFRDNDPAGKNALSAMAHYMPQDLFNGTVIALAFPRHAADIDATAAKAMRDKMLRTYSRLYVQDNFLTEANDCAARPLTWLRGIETDRDTQTVWLSTLAEAIYAYQPNGKRKRWRLFNGLRRSPQVPVPDRTDTYFKELESYYLHIQLGNYRSNSRAT